MKFDKLVLLAVVLCAVVFAGELMSLSPNPYCADAELEDGRIHISVTSPGADTYSIVVTDNGSHRQLTQLYIYDDELYDASYAAVNALIGLRRVDLSYIIGQITPSLNVRGFNNISIVNGEQLTEAINGDLSAGETSKGLLVMSYALPESIYDGSADSPILEWIREGGSLYWMDSPVGMFYHGDDGLGTVDDVSGLLFGNDGSINMGDTDLALSVERAGGLTNALFLKWNRVLYGLDISGINGAVSMGYSQDGYSSVSMVPFGDGMICVLGGTFDRYQCGDMAQIIASGISCHSKVLRAEEGNVTRGTVEVWQDVPEGSGSISVYVSIGGYYTAFGRAFQC
jgi:hypothetical protein